jgi:hypothetical protein
MIILESNSKFRNLLNVDIHNFTLVPHRVSPHKLIGVIPQLTLVDAYTAPCVLRL